MSAQPGPYFPIVQVDEMAFAMSLFVSAASLKTPSASTGNYPLPSREFWSVFCLLTESMRAMMPRHKAAHGESSLEHAS